MSRVELKGVNEDRLGDAGINNKILFGRLADAHSEQQTEKEVAPLIVARGDVQVKCRSLILQGGYACCALAFFLLQSADEIINIKVEMQRNSTPSLHPLFPPFFYF